MATDRRRGVRRFGSVALSGSGIDDRSMQNASRKISRCLEDDEKYDGRLMSFKIADLHKNIPPFYMTTIPRYSRTY